MTFSENPLADLTPYELRHLVGHLIEIGCINIIHRLLALETTKGDNAWFDAKRGDAPAFASDVADAWRVSEAPDAEGAGWRDGRTFGLQVRYALLIATVNSLADTFTPILGALVKHGLWTAENGLAHAVRIPDSDRRSRALAALAPYLSQPQVREALAATEAATAIAELARRLVDLGLPKEALSVLRKRPRGPIDKTWDETLADLIPRAAELGRQREALAATNSLNPHAAGEAWKRLWRNLPASLLRAGLRAIERTNDESPQSYALQAIIPRLDDSLLPVALGMAGRFKKSPERCEVLRALAPRLSPLLLNQALTLAREIEDVLYRARALIDLAARLPNNEEYWLREALNASRRIPTPAARVYELATVAGHMQGVARRAVLEEALDTVATIKDPYWEYALIRLAEVLPADLAPRVLPLAQTIVPGVERAVTLAELAQKLPEPTASEALGNALIVVNTLPHLDSVGGSPRAEALIKILPLLSGTKRKQALCEAMKVTQKNIEALRDPAYPLQLLAPYLSETMLREALEAALRIGGEHDRARALIVLGPYLPSTLLDCALAAAERLKLSDIRADVLSMLTQYLTGAQQARAVEAALASAHEVAARRIGGRDRSEVITMVALRLPAAFLPRAVEVFRRILDRTLQEKALAGLAVYLEEPAVSEMIDVLAQSQEPVEPEKVRLLTALAARLVECGFADHALSAVMRITSRLYRDTALCDLLPRLIDHGHAHLALTALNQIEEELYLSQQLVLLLPRLPEALLPDALAIADAIKHVPRRAETLCKVLIRLPRQERDSVAKRILDLARVLPPGTRHRVLVELVPFLPADKLQDSIEIARANEKKSVAVATLVEMAPHLPGSLKEEVLPELLAIAQKLPAIDGMTDLSRVEILAKLIPLSPLPLKGVAARAALRTALRIAEPGVQSKALEALASRLTKKRRLAVLERALNAARKIEGASERAEALLRIASQLPEPRAGELFDNALTSIRHESRVQERTMLLVKLSDYLQDPQKTERLREAVIAVRNETFEPHRLFVELAGHLPEPLRVDVLSSALVSAREKRPFRLISRKEALVGVAPLLATLTPESLRPLWIDTLRESVSGERGEVLDTVCALAPVLMVLGGPAATGEAFQAVKDAGRWWP